MRKLASLAAAAMVALPLIGFAAGGTAQAADVAFSISYGGDDARLVYYDRPTYGYRYGRSYVLPGPVVRSYLQRDFYRVSGVDRRGDVYVARAVDWRGRDVRIVASAYTGQIIDVDYIRWNGRGWHASARWNDWRNGYAWNHGGDNNHRNGHRGRDWNDRDGYDSDGDGRDRDRGRR